MYQSVVTLLSSLVRPTRRLRTRCWLLLALLVVTLLNLGSSPGVYSVVSPYLPWDKLAHATAYGGFAALGWVAMGGRSDVGAVLLAGVIGLMDEGMQSYMPFRTSDWHDIVADLVGATLVVLALKALQAADARKREVVMGRPVHVQPAEVKDLL
jgi:VanZ family protein